MKDNDKISSIDFKSKRSDKVKARKLVAEIVNRYPQNISFSGHALSELQKDALTTVDAWNILKSTAAKIHGEGELEKGSYRYRLETNFIMVVISFWPDGKGLTIVTAWDKRKKGKS
jgi:hypothetical protein